VDIHRGKTVIDKNMPFNSMNSPNQALIHVCI